MNEKLLLGVKRFVIPIPPWIWKRQMSNIEVGTRDLLSFMTPDHHRVRDFVVVEMSKVGKPLSAELISRSLNLPFNRVPEIILDLEQHMTFLFTNDAGDVTWAYPVTAEKTPHHVSFSTGETIYAA